MTSDNKPSPTAVSHAFFQAAVWYGHLDIVSHLTNLDSDNQLSQLDIKIALFQTADLDTHLDITKHLTTLTGNNKPSQEGIHNALKEACLKIKGRTLEPIFKCLAGSLADPLQLEELLPLLTTAPTSLINWVKNEINSPKSDLTLTNPFKGNPVQHTRALLNNYMKNNTVEYRFFQQEDEPTGVSNR